MLLLKRVGFVFGVGAAIFLGACSSTPVEPEANRATAPIPAGVRSTQTAVPPVAATPAPVAKSAIAPHANPASLLFQRRSVYFDFDQTALKADAIPVLELHGKYLAANPQVALVVEGNTDEQGGTEYNLALGQKRAMAVVSALMLYGAKDAQLEAVSFGEEKPQAAGHDEAAFKVNRRADLMYRAK